MTIRSTGRARAIVLALVVLAVLLVGGFLFWKQKPFVNEMPNGAMPVRPALTVSVARPEQRELPITLSANGNIAAWQEASIGSELPGLRLADVRVNVGDGVKKGQVLATFSSDSVQAEVAQARAALAEARAAAADAAASATRARTLEATGALSQQQINQYMTAEQTSRARAAAAEAVLAAQQVRGRNLQVRAPDDGVISARSATVGSVLGSGAELFRLIRQGRLEWRAQVTSSELARIAPGTKVTVTSASGQQVPGTVRSVAPTVDPQTRTAIVYVDIPKVTQASGIKAGMFARGEFELGTSNATTVPQAAVVPRDGFNYLLLLQLDQRVREQKVETGRRIGDRIEIRSELPSDARVVVQGAGFLNDGDLVRVVDALGTDVEKVPAAATKVR